MYVGITNCKLSMSLISNTLPVINEVRDLGVFADSNVTFHSHVDKIVARAFIRSNLILKCFVSRDVSTLMRVFTVYVHPYWNMLRAFGPHISWGKSNKLNLSKEVSPDDCYIIHVLIIKQD